MARRSVALAALALSTLAACAGPSRETLARRSLATELVAQRKWDSAFGVVQPLCIERPDDAEALMLRGIIYTEQKLLDEAQADLEQAIRLEDGIARAHSSLGILYDIRGRSGDAVKQHRRAVELAPNHPAYLNNLGFSLFASGRAREAIPFFHEALRLSPTDPKIRNNLGFAYAAAGDFTHAAQHFELGGQPSEAKNNLGWAYERKGALAQAYQLYSEAVRLNPQSTIARENLSRVTQALGSNRTDAEAVPRS